MSMAPSSSAGISVNLPPANEALVREEFAPHRRLSVRQKRRWWEFLTNWEAKNSYAIFDEEGNHTLQVKEEGNGFVNILKRLFLRTARPFDATVYDNPIPRPILSLHRPFRFIFQELQVSAADGRLMGKIVREWSWIRRIYRIEDERGVEVARLFGPFFRPWTFEIQVRGEVRGMVQKRWSGSISELFTDADNFAVEFSEIDDPKLKALCFASTVLIDIVHFEDAKHN